MQISVQILQVDITKEKTLLQSFYIIMHSIDRPPSSSDVTLSTPC